MGQAGGWLNCYVIQKRGAGKEECLRLKNNGTEFIISN